MSSRGFGGAEQRSYGSTSARAGGTFEEQSRSISSLIFKVSNNAVVLERTAKKIGTKDDGSQLRDEIHSIQMDSREQINQITAALQSLVSHVGRGDRQQKIQADRLKASFTTTLQRYGNIQSKVKDQLKSDELKTHSRRNTFNEEPDTWSDESKLLEQQQRREQLQQQQLIVEDEFATARDREDRIRQVESDIVDVNDIFKQLGTMVYEQGEAIDSIEENISRAADNVDSGNVQLTAAASYQRSARKKMCILFIILVIVAGIVALILGLTLGKKS